MIIIRQSSLTGQIHIRQLEVTLDQIHLWLDGMPIQRAMPQLSNGDREFFLSGITDQEWQEAFGPPPEEP